jgi:hypothetical protein
MKEIPSVESELRALLAKLPQNAVVTEGHRERWLEQVVRNAASGGLTAVDLKLAVRDLAGIRDSEIGALVLTARDLPSPWQTPRDIVAQKLLIEPPGAGRSAEQREARALPMLRGMTEDRFRGFQYLEEESGNLGWVRHPDHRWMCGSIDDLYLIDGVETLVRFRIPEPVEAKRIGQGGDLPLGWQCEANQGLLLAGSKLGRVINRAAFVILDTEQFSLRVVRVDGDRALQEELTAVGGRVWRDHVLSGNVPEIAAKFEIGRSEFGEGLQALALEYAGFRALSTVAAGKADDIQQRIAEKVGARLELGDGKLDYLVTTVTGRPDWDVQGMAVRLTEVGGNPDSCRKNAPDPDGALAALREMQAMTEVVQEGINAGVDRFDLAERIRPILGKISTTPLTKPGGFEPEILQNHLRAFDVNPSRFRREVVTVSLPKTGKGPAGRAIEQVKEGLADLIEKVGHQIAAATAAAAAPMSVAGLAADATAAGNGRDAPLKRKKP